MLKGLPEVVAPGLSDVVTGVGEKVVATVGETLLAFVDECGQLIMAPTARPRARTIPSATPTYQPGPWAGRTGVQPALSGGQPPSGENVDSVAVGKAVGGVWTPSGYGWLGCGKGRGGGVWYSADGLWSAEGGSWDPAGYGAASTPVPTSVS